MSSKTNKAAAKRLKKRGSKFQARRPGQTHFNAKESGEDQHKKKRMQDFDMKKKDKDRFLPHA